jgi:hypothetical protein
VNRSRYEGYKAVHGAIAAYLLDEYASNVLAGFAEALLLARRRSEADDAVAVAPDALTLLVDRGDLSRSAATRFWALLRACGPPTSWPPSWDRHTPTSPKAAVRGR